MADQQYSGEGLAVWSSPEGAELRCVFQRLNARATAQGLWLVSTVDGAKGEPFRVVAKSVGRGSEKGLPIRGRVEVEEKVARCIRPGLTEEYRVSADGVSQDFVLEARPAGSGTVRVELEVEGAKAEALGNGARLVLADDGRKILYHRLKAEDARGNEVKARLEVVSGRHLTVVLEDTGAEYPVRIDPTFSDANWIGLGGVPGADGYVDATVLDGAGNLYVGGSFTVAGNVIANSVAEWNGSSWSALGSGMDSDVYALVMLGTNLYAGGAFTTAGGVSANCIAKWNGSSWSALSTGMSGAGSDGYGPYVNALAVSGTNLYAGGDFTTAGVASANYVAKWNGSSWSALGPGLNNSVYALVVSGTNLNAGGDFTKAGTSTVNCIAKWNGSSWSTLSTGMSGAGNDGNGPYVNALAVSGANLYAGGDFTKAGAATANYIAKWNGSAWSALGGGISGAGSDGSGPYVNALAVSGTTVYAGGEFTTAGSATVNSIAQWNGTVWSALGSGMSMGDDYYVSYVYALGVSGNTVYAGGAFNTAGGVTADSVAEWNGSSWSGFGSGMNSFVSALAVVGNTLYVGGDFITVAGGISANYIAQWNGSSWSGLSSGMDSDVFALAVLGTNLYAGGDFSTAGGVSANCVAQWNGSAWSAMDLGVSGAGSDGYGPYVNALVVAGTNLYAGGDFSAAGVVSASNIAQWNGNSWSAMGLGITGTGIDSYGPRVNALAASGNTVYAGGDFTTAGGVSATNIAQWQYGSWSAMGSGISDAGSDGYGPYVSALAVSGDILFAGGDFATAGGVPASSVAEWDGNSWSFLGSGISGAGSDGYGPYVNALTVSGTNLYAGGDFSVAGGVSVDGIAQWDSNAWSGLGSGISGGYGGPDVYALAMLGNSLFAGGWFSVAGTNVSAYVAQAIVGTTPPFIITTNSNFGFTNGRSQFGFDVLAPGDVGQRLVIQASTNLVNWAPLQTNVLNSFLFHFSDPNASNFTRQFYRAQMLPY